MKYKLTIDRDGYPVLWEDNGIVFDQSYGGVWYRPDDTTGVTMLCGGSSKITPYTGNIDNLTNGEVYTVDIDVNVVESETNMDEIEIPEEKIIVVEWIEEKQYGYGNAMVVVESTHERFTVGTRFDFGFFNIATDDGYTIVSLPMKE